MKNKSALTNRLFSGILLYGTYRLWAWSILAPKDTLPTPLPQFSNSGDFDTNLQNITAAITTLNETAILVPLALGLYDDPIIAADLTTATNTNNLLTQPIDGNKNLLTISQIASNVSNTVLTTSETDLVLGQSDNNGNARTTHDLLYILMPHINTARKIKTNNKKKHSKLSATLDFNLVTVSITKPQPPKSQYSHGIINVETTDSNMTSKQTTQHAKTNLADLIFTTLSENLTASQNTFIETKIENNMIKPTSFKITTHNTDDRLLLYQNSNDSFSNTSHIRETGYIISADFSKPERDANKTSRKYNQATKTTPIRLMREVERKSRSNKQNILKTLIRKIRHNKIYYKKSYKESQLKAKALPISETTTEASTPTEDDSESNERTETSKTISEIDDDEDETEFNDNTDVNTQLNVEKKVVSKKQKHKNTKVDISKGGLYNDHKIKTRNNGNVGRTESSDTMEASLEKNKMDKCMIPKVSLKRKMFPITRNISATPIKNIEHGKVDNNRKSNTSNDDEEDDTESEEVTEVLSTTPKCTTPSIQIVKLRRTKKPKNNYYEVKASIIDEEDETESDEVTEVSTQFNSTTRFETKDKRTKLPTTVRYILGKGKSRDMGINHKNSKIGGKPKSFSKTITTSYDNEYETEDEIDYNDEPTSSTTPDEVSEDAAPDAAMDILYILKTRIVKPTPELSLESRDLLELFKPNDTSNK